MQNMTELETKELFLRDAYSINHMTPTQVKIIQKCVLKSKKKRPWSSYNYFVKDQLEKLETRTELKPREKIKMISDAWKQMTNEEKQRFNSHNKKVLLV